MQTELKDGIFSALASILHIGNLFFSREDTKGVEGSKLEAEDELLAIGALLGVPPNGLRTCLTNKVTVSLLISVVYSHALPFPHPMWFVLFRGWSKPNCSMFNRQVASFQGKYQPWLGGAVDWCVIVTIFH